MNVKAVAWVRTQRIPQNAEIILQALAATSCDLGYCGTHDVRVLARRCVIAERTARRVLSFLKNTGRVFVQRQSSDQGLQIQSKFQLNLDRPADPQHPDPRSRNANLAEQAPCRSASLEGLRSGGSANQAERSFGSSARAVPASCRPCQQAVVVSINRKQQQQPKGWLAVHPLQGHDAELVTLLHETMGVGYKRLHALCEQYPSEHLRDAMANVIARHKMSPLRNPAGYFLTVVNEAPVGSLSSKEVGVDVPSATVQTAAATIALSVTECSRRQALKQEQLSVENEWNARTTFDRDALRAQFDEHLADNRVVFDSLRRSGPGAESLRRQLLMSWLVARNRANSQLRLAAGATERD